MSVFYYFRSEEMKLFEPQADTYKTRWEIPFVTYSWNGIAPYFDKTSEKDLKISYVLRSLWYQSATQQIKRFVSLTSQIYI